MSCPLSVHGAHVEVATVQENYMTSPVCYTPPPAHSGPISSMESSPQGVRQTHRLLHKFAPSRWRQARHTRSQDGFAVEQVNDHTDAAYTLPPQDHFSSLSDTHHRIAEGSIESLVSPVLFPTTGSVPPYTPVPVPERISSAQKATHPPRVSSVKRQSATYRLFPKDDGDTPLSAHLDRLRGANSVQNDTSLVAAGFEDDLLLPQPPVPLKRPGHDMSRPFTKESSSSATSRPRGRSRERSDTTSQVASTPATETESTGGPTHKGSTKIPVFPAPNRVQSPIGSVLATLPSAPAKLSNDVVAHLQDPCPDKIDILNTDLNDVDDPDSWSIISPNAKPLDERDGSQFWLEKRAEQLYSAEHLHLILKDPRYHSKFLGFMRKYRPWRAPILSYYWDACKALKAQDYANALAARLSEKSPLSDGAGPKPGPVENEQLLAAARVTFAELLKDDLHYFIAHTYIKIVSALVARRITGNLPAHLDEASGRLAEVFCVTDCRLRDDPIILASEGFTRHSGGSLEYVLGRNCRFMQGPGTTVDSCRRFAISCQQRRDHTEIFVNYRRDGTPFLSLVMNAPLLDSNGNLRYFLGAQVDVSALLKDCAGLESLSSLIEQQAAQKKQTESEEQEPDPREHIKALSEMFTGVELDIVRKHGGSSQRGRMLDTRTSKIPTGGNRVLLADGSEDSDDANPGYEPSVPETTASNTAVGSMDGTPGNLSGVYKHYVLVRPGPSLRVLFASPTMRVQGILQSPFLHSIGGNGRVREDLEAALRESKGVTARVKWLNTPSEEGDGPGVTRWLHCTPLIHYTGQVGLWMIVLIRPDGDGVSLRSNNASTGSRSASVTARPVKQEAKSGTEAVVQADVS